MFVFSCNATAKTDLAEVKQGETLLFMVYINYADLFGAEQLCQMYLMREGFTNIEMEKRKFIQAATVEKLKFKEKDIQEAMKDGFFIRMFEAD